MKQPPVAASTDTRITRFLFEVCNISWQPASIQTHSLSWQTWENMTLNTAFSWGKDFLWTLDIISIIRLSITCCTNPSRSFFMFIFYLSHLILFQFKKKKEYDTWRHTAGKKDKWISPLSQPWVARSLILWHFVKFKSHRWSSSRFRCSEENPLIWLDQPA